MVEQDRRAPVRELHERRQRQPRELRDFGPAATCDEPELAGHPQQIVERPRGVASAAIVLNLVRIGRQTEKARQQDETGQRLVGARRGVPRRIQNCLPPESREKSY